MDLRSKRTRPRNSASRNGFRLIVLVMLGVLGMPGLAMDSDSWWNDDWAYRKQITINPPAIQNSTGDLGEVPVLIRIHEGILNFTDLAADGADLRFVADDDLTPLKFHIEKFDSVFNLAYVWVRLPRLEAGTPTTIWMYYGNAEATSDSESEQTYDTNQTLVYHFGERNAPPMDPTSYRNKASTPFVMEEGGLIGSAAKFDGQSVVALPASPSLAVSADGALTVSLWFKPVAGESDGVLYSHKDGERGLTIGLAGGSPYVAIVDQNGQRHQSSPIPAVDEKNWHHIAVTVAEQTTMYVDGKPGPALDARLPALNIAATVGGEIGVTGAPVASGFTGEIDELQISKLARDPALIEVAVANQGPGDAMVQFGGDEVQPSLSTGYVGIILGSLTVDAWVVMGILTVMMFVSWYVMAAKARQIGRVSKANKAFLQLFRSSGGDFSQFDNLTGANSKQLKGKEGQLLKHSPLLHMYRSGVEQLRQRLERNASAVLSAQSIEAIRAEIDSRIVQELQSLSSQMVLLTIAISGGPFIGLLGTVLGVMITFAGVAAAGDVNINAIAPGISAALAATVAGMFVAIPALFGYNYLLTRIKECSAEMQVFADTFITRMAESYNSPVTLHAMTDG